MHLPFGNIVNIVNIATQGKGEMVSGMLIVFLVYPHLIPHGDERSRKRASDHTRRSFDGVNLRHVLRYRSW